MNFSKLILWTAVLTLSACSFNKKHANNTETSHAVSAETWQGKMILLGDKLTTLIPYLSDSKKFNAFENEKVIKEKLSEILSLSKQLNSDREMMKMDPSMKLINAQFEDEIVRGLNTFNLGLKDYSRFTLKNSTSYCIQCHTRTNVGPAFSTQNLDKVFGQMQPIEKGEFLTATRNFDAALKEFNQIIESDPAKSSFNVWERATRNSLAIAVKFKQDPDLALSTITKVKNAQSAPKYLRDYAVFWTRSVESWKKEKNPQPLKFDAQLKKAQQLVTKGQALQDENRHAGDIEFLRATAILHKILGETEKSSTKAQIYWLLGQSYDSLTDLDFWQMTEGFYEKCITTAPFTKMAKTCFEEYKNKVTLGYTGTAGTDIPAEIQKNIDELQKSVKK